MTARFLVDTNVLVYAEDADEPVKRAQAQELLATLARAGTGAVTTQVLGEYLVTVTRRFASGLGADEAAERVERLSVLFRVLDVTLAVVREATRGVTRYRMSYYDAQIWAAARLAGIGVVLSEDFSSGAEIEGVRFVNPFAEGFKLP